MEQQQAKYGEGNYQECGAVDFRCSHGDEAGCQRTLTTPCGRGMPGRTRDRQRLTNWPRGTGSCAAMPSQDKRKPISYRAPEALDAWVRKVAQETTRAVNAIITGALEEIRQREEGEQ